MSETVPQVTVWFDGACPLCLKEIALMRRLDRRQRIEFVDATDEEAACPVSRQALLARFHAREGERLYSGAEAFAAMWRAIPVLRPFGIAARIPLVLWGLEKLYLGFLRFRPRLQRLFTS
jgi:predicted DCC family thiol-disulfide oxidoreductase YuxK